MYIPSSFSVEDIELIKKFIFENSFASLISETKNELNVNHYPFLLEEHGEKLILWTHLAKSNPQWKNIEGQTCLVIFTGPQAYISPTYYVSKLHVPTWNYTAVHAIGKASIISNRELELELMKKMVSFFESQNKTNWNYDLPSEFHDNLLNAIVWIKLEVIKVDAKFKLSQNRNESDYSGVVQALSNREGTRDILKYMNATNPHTKK